MPRLLLHICCAPCLCHPYRVLSDEKIDFSGFWYNPNIHPYTEYRNRLQAVKDFSQAHRMPVIFLDRYPLEESLEGLAGERCRWCYRIRLEATARQAKAQGYQSFSTTLLYSIYQKHDLIRELGEAAGKEYGVGFFYRDFRQGWEEGKRMAGEQCLYRQKYCGCIFSERDRYLKA
jgi:predicted adenine nucleotide alpha hydrolase (AANH) superfamily ATPase